MGNIPPAPSTEGLKELFIILVGGALLIAFVGIILFVWLLSWILPSSWSFFWYFIVMIFLLSLFGLISDFWKKRHDLQAFGAIGRFFDEMMRKRKSQWNHLRKISIATDKDIPKELASINSLHDIEEIHWTDAKETPLLTSDVNKLCTWLKYNGRQLRVLDMRSFKLRDFKPICDVLHENKSLKVLNLFGNNLIFDSDVKLQVILQMLATNSSITSLDIGGNEISDSDDLCNFIKVNSTLASLNLSDNSLSLESAKKISSSLISSPYFSLTSLNLNNNSRAILSPLLDSINDILNSNKLVQTSEVVIKNFSTDTNIRCYNLPLSDLESLFEKLKNESKIYQISSIFIYGTNLTDSFVSKWFPFQNQDQMKFSNLSSLALIKCGIISCNFISPYMFPSLASLNLSHNDDLNHESLLTSIKKFPSLKDICVTSSSSSVGSFRMPMDDLNGVFSKNSKTISSVFIVHSTMPSLYISSKWLSDRLICQNISSLALINCGVSLCDFLSLFSQLRCLNLSRNDKLVIVSLCDNLKNLQHIQNVSVFECGFNSFDFQQQNISKNPLLNCFDNWLDLNWKKDLLIEIAFQSLKNAKPAGAFGPAKELFYILSQKISSLTPSVVDQNDKLKEEESRFSHEWQVSRLSQILSFCGFDPGKEISNNIITNNISQDTIVLDNSTDLTHSSSLALVINATKSQLALAKTLILFNVSLSNIKFLNNFLSKCLNLEKCAIIGGNINDVPIFAKALKQMLVYGNGLYDRLPDQVKNNSTSKIAQYFNDLFAGAVVVRCGKVMVVGYGEAGKTSLLDEIDKIDADVETRTDYLRHKGKATLGSWKLHVEQEYERFNLFQKKSESLELTSGKGNVATKDETHRLSINLKNNGVIKTTHLYFANTRLLDTFHRRVQRLLLTVAESRTIGIEIRTWQFTTTSSNSKKQITTINAWDFGGQEMYYHTHKFFLTSKAVYAVVFDLSKGIAGYNDLRHWLQSLKYLVFNNITTRESDNSNNNNNNNVATTTSIKTEPLTILIVGTKLDKLELMTGDVGEKKKMDRKMKIANIWEEIIDNNNNSSSNLKYEYHEISTRKNLEVIDGVKSSIESKVEILVGDGDFVPSSYMNILDIVKFLRETKPIVRFDELQKECRIEHDVVLKRALTFLHNWSECVWLGGDNSVNNDISTDESLNENNSFDIIVLQPQWLTQTVFGRLVKYLQDNSNSHFGKLKWRELEQILCEFGKEEEKVEKSLLPQVVELLEEYSLAFKWIDLTSNNMKQEISVFIPSTLPANRNELSSQPTFKQFSRIMTHPNYVMWFESDHLMHGLLGVMMKLLMEKNVFVYFPECWQNGIAFGYDGTDSREVGVILLIPASDGDKRSFIRVNLFRSLPPNYSGDGKWEMIEILENNVMKELRNKWNGIKIKRKYHCPSCSNSLVKNNSSATFAIPPEDQLYDDVGEAGDDGEEQKNRLKCKQAVDVHFDDVGYWLHGITIKSNNSGDDNDSNNNNNNNNDDDEYDFNNNHDKNNHFDFRRWQNDVDERFEKLEGRVDVLEKRLEEFMLNTEVPWAFIPSFSPPDQGMFNIFYAFEIRIYLISQKSEHDWDVIDHPYVIPVPKQVIQKFLRGGKYIKLFLSGLKIANVILGFVTAGISLTTIPIISGLEHILKTVEKHADAGIKLADQLQRNLDQIDTYLQSSVNAERLETIQNSTNSEGIKNILKELDKGNYPPWRGLKIDLKYKDSQGRLLWKSLSQET